MEGVLGGAVRAKVIALLAAVLALNSAASSPIVASLIGDFLPPRDRSQVYGRVLSGELVGAGVG
jgi:hypothetical protein